MDYLVNQDADKSLAAIEARLKSDWPFIGKTTRSERMVVFVHRENWAKRLFLRRPPKTIRIFATPQGVEKSRLTVRTEVAVYAREIEKVLRTELGATRAGNNE